MNPLNVFSRTSAKPKVARAYLGLGSNLGDSQSHLHDAIRKLDQVEGIHVDQVSKFIVTPALAETEQPDYLNAVVRVNTSLSPEQLFQRTTMIEDQAGRVRTGEKWAPRTLDIDILLFGSEVIETPTLTVPHPQMHLRSFVIKPLLELDAKLHHPTLKRPFEHLLERLNGQDFFVAPHKPKLISIAGLIGVGKTTLANALSDWFGCRCIEEAYDKNPFLPKVYGGETDLALDSQLFFLKSRIDQLLQRNFKAGEFAITDYIFEKELIYAQTLLQAGQYDEYYREYNEQASRITRPAVVIYLKASVQKCLERIHYRNRPYEQKIESSLLEQLDRKYEELMENWVHCPVLRVYDYEYDFNEPEHMERFASEVVAYL